MIEEELKIIPKPVKVSLNDGAFFLSQETTIQADLTSTRNGEYLIETNKMVNRKEFAFK